MAQRQTNWSLTALRFFITAAVLLLVIGIYGCSGPDAEKDEEVLATVGDYEISKTHYINELRRVNARAGYALNLSPDVMKSVLNSRLNRYVVVSYAKDKGWHETPEARHQKTMIERKSIMEEFERRFITDRVEISEEDLRELFYRVNTSVRASHLYARNRHDADSLFALLQEGRSFESLAADIFRNPDLARSGGDLGFFTVDDMDISFEDMAYRLDTGEVSEPVKTSRGYSIIKVTDIVTTPVITETQFAEKRKELEMIARSQQEELAVREHLRSGMASYNIDAALLEQLWDAVSNDPAGYLDVNPELNRVQVSMPADLRGRTLIEQNGFIFTVDDFLREAHFTSFSQRRQADNIRTFESHLRAMAYRAQAIEQARSHPGYHAEYVQRTIEETFYSYLNEQFNDYIASKVKVDDADIRAEYEANPDYYVEPLQLDMAEIVVTSEQAAEHVWNRLKSGADFNETLMQFTADPGARENYGRIGFTPIEKFGMMAPALENTQPGDYAGPFQITGSRFHIFKCLGRIEPRQLTFEEAVPQVERVLKSEAKEKLKMQKIGEARDRFNATVYDDRLFAIPIQL